MGRNTSGMSDWGMRRASRAFLSASPPLPWEGVGGASF